MDKGTLYIIATPIGNLDDMTLRAIDTLKNTVDYVFTEDTRQSRKLLDHYGIRKPVSSLHSHSTEKKLNHAMDLLKKGSSIAYITDSGTPGISDPGSRLVSNARENGITISPLPGPSALASLISVSGFSGKNVIFGGFISKKPGKRINELTELKKFNGIIILYESPARIKKCLMAINEVFRGCDIVIAREMTKIHEEFISGRIEDIISSIDQIKEKGEFSIAINNRE